MTKKGFLWIGLCIVLFFLLLAAAFLLWKNYRDLPEETEISGGGATVLINPDLPLPETLETVEYEYGGYGISLPLFDGWDYQIEEYDEEKTYYGIRIRPEGSVGEIFVCYHTAFGVCGTGLTEQKSTLGDYQVSVGTYDGASLWDFIVIQNPDIDGRFVITRYGDLPWWDTKGEEALQLLHSLKITVPEKE